jgi:hypothetical protein
MVLYSGSKSCIVPLFLIGIKSPELFHISHGIKKQYQDRTWSLGSYAALSMVSMITMRFPHDQSAQGFSDGSETSLMMTIT